MRWRRSALFRPRSRLFYRTGLRYWVIYLAWRGLPLLAFAVLCFPALLAAAKPQATSSDSTEYDNQLDLRARKVLLDDAQLAPHNLGVTVRDSTVTVWGIVPSESLARRATERLRQIPGVAEVRSDLRIEPPDDPIVEFLNQPLPRPTGAEPERSSAPRRRPGELTGRTGDDKKAPSPDRPSVVLLKPVAIAPGGTLPEEVERLRQQDARFGGIKTEIQGRTVYLRGDAGHRQDLQELARRVSRLAGVEHVIVREVRGEEPRHPVTGNIR